MGRPLEEAPKFAEMQQMLVAPSDAYPAGVWCELANNLMSEVEQLRAELLAQGRVIEAAHAQILRLLVTKEAARQVDEIVSNPSYDEVEQRDALAELRDAVAAASPVALTDQGETL